MNKSQLKSYAPRARREFVQMVRQRADILGLTKRPIDRPRVEGDIAIIEGRPYPRRYAELHSRIATTIAAEGLEQYLDRIAYSWFNRFAALRFMEIHGYLSHPFRVLSNRDAGKSEPEILEHAAEVTLAGLDRNKVLELKLAGNKDSELYKILLIAQCNELNAAMPFLFERINDETEILLSDNLLHTDSVIRKMVSAIDEENWSQIEIVGWLYQFYISERKDEVIGKVVKSEDIPAATQLFTPNWIVKYMTQNSLGRLWLEANPHSQLKTEVPMEFYIEPAADNPKIERGATNPEEITILDPACGSGHILVEAYDILKTIYIERGYSLRDIPELILKNNLFGLEIDERAAQLASFALLMKVRADDRKLFDKDREHLVPNILAIPDSSKLEYKPREMAEMFLTEGTSSKTVPIRDSNLLFEEIQTQPSLTMTTAAAAAGSTVTETNVVDLLELFEQGKTLGSLIRIPDGFEKVIDNIEASIVARQTSSDMMAQIAARQLVLFVRAAKMLARKYHCVIANPPYMGGGGMNGELKAFAGRNFPDSKSDLFAMFIEREMEHIKSHGYVALVTPFVWMFISSYAKFRRNLIEETPISSLIQLEYNAFEPACVPVCTFTIHKDANVETKGEFIKLSEFKGHQNQAPKTLEAINSPNCGWRFQASTADFEKIPGSPIAYWLGPVALSIFHRGTTLGGRFSAKSGVMTGDDDFFLRNWHEVSISRIGFGYTLERDIRKGHIFFPMNKEEGFRKWSGRFTTVFRYVDHGREHAERDDINYRLRNKTLYFLSGISWGDVTSGPISFRYQPKGLIFAARAPTIFRDDKVLLGFLNSNVAVFFASAINPTLSFNLADLYDLPLLTDEIENMRDRIEGIVKSLISLSSQDWHSFETSWDFSRLPILDFGFWIENCGTAPTSVEAAYNNWEALCDERMIRMQELETENNRLFIDAYGLQDELSPEVPLDQITLARADKEKDTRRLLSYFIGCLMGRYSLDEPGLIYADAGGVGFAASRYKKFPTDDDGIVPVTDMEWFPQEAARQFEKFIAVAFGDIHHRGTENPEGSENVLRNSVSLRDSVVKNLSWVANQLGAKAGEEPIETIRRYFSTEFYKNHMQTYKKRPIYWLFSSGKQKAFEALVYLHRYNESTLPRMRHEYVLPLMSKIEAQIETLAGPANDAGVRSGGLIDTSSSASERNKLTKQLETLKKKQIELAAFDENLRHYADMRISLDLDDGVKVNYGKFSDLLAEVKAITGAKE